MRPSNEVVHEVLSQGALEIHIGKLLAIQIYLIKYSMVSNNSAGWNKSAGWHCIQKLIILQDGIILQVELFQKR